MYQRLAPGDKLKAETDKHLKQFSGEGFRILCVAQAIIDEETYQVQCKNHSHSKYTTCRVLYIYVGRFIWGQS